MYKGTPPSRRTPGKARPTPSLAAFRAIVRIEGLLRRLSEPHFAFYGVSPAQWGVLRSLERLEMSNKAQPRMHELGEAAPGSAPKPERHAGPDGAWRPDLAPGPTLKTSGPGASLLTGAGREVLAGAP